MNNRTLVVVLTVASLVILACAGGSSNVASNSRTNLNEKPMPGNEFVRFQEELAAEELPENRLIRIEQAAQTKYFMTSQVRGLMDLFDHTDDRLTALELISSRLIDMNNTYSNIIVHLPEEERPHAQAILNATGSEREAIIAERERQEEEERRARQEQQRIQMQQQMDQHQQRREERGFGDSGSDSQHAGGGGGSSSEQTCCLNGQFFECPSAAAVAKCVPPEFVRCISDTMDMMTCADEYPPDPSDCDRTPARDQECD